jgi:PAS domain S-box-containing protein
VSLAPQAALLATVTPPPGRSLAGALSDVVSVLGPDGRFRFVSSALYGLLGLSPDQVVGRPAVDLLHPDDVAAFLHRLRRFGAGEPVSSTVRYRLHHADGSWRAVEVLGVNRLDDPDVRGVVTVTRALEPAPAAERLDLLEALVDALPEPVALVDANAVGDPARIVFVNAAFADRFGHRPADVLGRPVGAVLVEGTDERLLAEPGAPGELVEIALRNGAGDPVWVDVSVCRVPLPWGGPGAVPSYLMAVLRDASERRAIAARWSDSRDRIRRLAEQSPDAVYRVRIRPSTEIEFLSPAIEHILGHTADEIRRDPKLIERAVHPDDRARMLDLVRNHAGPPAVPAPPDGVAEPVDGLVLRWRHRDGRIVWTEVRSVFERDEDGTVVAIEGAMRDVTARQIADRAMAEREELGRAVLDGIGAETVVIDPHGVITRANRAWTDLVAIFDPSEVDAGVGRPYLEVVKGVLGVSASPDELARGIAEVTRGVRAHLALDVASDVHGIRRWFALRVSPLVGVPGGGAVLTHSEITPRKEAEAQLAASEARYRSIIDTVHDVVFQCDTEGRFTFLNAAWEQLSGHPVPASLGQPFWARVVESERERVRAGFRAFLDGATGGSEPLRVTLACGGGGLRTVEVRPRLFREDGRVVGATGTMVDMTSQLIDEVEVRHAQKLEAVGRLAAGIAHEVNTPVQFVGDNLQFLDDAFGQLVGLLGQYRRSLSPDSEIKTWAERQSFLNSAEINSEAEYYEEEIPRAVAEAREGAQRIASIVRAMKAFGHPDAAEQQATDLNAAVRNTVVVARNEYKYVADVELDLGELPAVVCHGGDVNQALLNLIVNAAHAISDVVGESGGRGRISVSTELDGDTVVVRVADTGTGVPEDIRHRVFEPFFTTKEVGRGTGQGLALVRAVADRHHGQVALETSPAGTTFTLRLPVGGTGASTRGAVT